MNHSQIIFFWVYVVIAATARFYTAFCMLITKKKKIKKNSMDLNLIAFAVPYL